MTAGPGARAGAGWVTTQSPAGGGEGLSEDRLDKD